MAKQAKSYGQLKEENSQLWWYLGGIVAFLLCVLIGGAGSILR